MGSGSFNSASYRAFSHSTVGRTTEEIYTSRSIDPYLDPKGIKVRESRDSADNPNATPLIVALDVTGSMGILADNIARSGLGVLFEAILSRRPISDPHLMFMGIGDAHYDRAPLQVSQFEADNRIVDQLTKLYIEHGGGGNDSESYNLAWYFAAMHTVHDSIEKRGKRGYLFTVGDEQYPENVTKEQIASLIGDSMESTLSSQDMLDLAKRKYDVYHIIIEEGSYARSHPDLTFDSWARRLGQQVIRLSDHTKLSETIVSAIEVAEGRDAAYSAGEWGGKTAEIVHKAISGLPRGAGRPQLGGPA